MWMILSLVCCAFPTVYAVDNLALNKDASQSSVYQNGDILGSAEKAVDGNQKPYFNHGSCTQTNNEDMPWWRVDLGGSYSIYQVEITNRKHHGVWKRLHNFNIRVLMDFDAHPGNTTQSDVCYHVSGAQQREAPVLYYCKTLIVGRYVKIELLNPGTLSLCEVKVFGDVDECVLKTDNCSVNAGCVNPPGTYNCTCFPGYNGDGLTCTDVDECVLKTDNCSVNAGCVKTPGSYNCTCFPGYNGDGLTCTDVDERVLKTDNCSVNAGCVNTPGSYNCTCLPDFKGDGLTCTGVSSVNQTQYCRCPCPKNLTKEESKAFMSEILESLTINKTKASAYRRKHVSAPDGRVSAQSFGYGGTAILVIVFGGIFLSDLPRLLTDFRQLIHNLCNIGR